MWKLATVRTRSYNLGIASDHLKITYKQWVNSKFTQSLPWHCFTLCVTFSKLHLMLIVRTQCKSSWGAKQFLALVLIVTRHENARLWRYVCFWIKEHFFSLPNQHGPILEAILSTATPFLWHITEGVWCSVIPTYSRRRKDSLFLCVWQGKTGTPQMADHTSAWVMCSTPCS